MRHNVNTLGLFPEDALPLPDSSPDMRASPSRRVVVLSNNSKPAGNRYGTTFPTREGSASPEDSDTAVPFPRSALGGHSSTPSGTGQALIVPEDGKTPTQYVSS